MYALRKGVEDLSSGTHVRILRPGDNAQEVYVETVGEIPIMQHHHWFDSNRTQHHESRKVGAERRMFATTRDNLVLLRGHEPQRRQRGR